MAPPQVSPLRLYVSASAYVKRHEKEWPYGSNSGANEPHHKKDKERNAFCGEGMDDQMIPPRVDCVGSDVGVGLRPNRWEGKCRLRGLTQTLTIA